MSKIIQLPPHVADKIAAGEVVERPGSVLKELAENAIDAGAGAVTCEIQNGGMSYIRVTDDGCGMEPEEAPAAFLRHATSKIRTDTDLAAIGTLGFRGEALAAIGAVSRIDLLTRPRGRDEGVSLRIEGGQVVESAPAGCPEGTTVIVRDLFYNTPARLKFMKTDSAESSYCTGVILRLALSGPNISFRMLRDGKEEFHTPGDGKLYSTVYNLLGRDYALGLVEAGGAWDDIKIRGYVTKSTAGRGNRSFQHFFINGRHVKSKLLTAALEQAYKNRLMTGRYPGCVLHVDMPLDSLDVNVHPAKTEVRFVREKPVFDAVYHAVKNALALDEGRPEAVWSGGGKPQTDIGHAPAANQTASTRTDLNRASSTSGDAPCAAGATGGAAGGYFTRMAAEKYQKELQSGLDGVLPGQQIFSDIPASIKTPPVPADFNRALDTFGADKAQTDRTDLKCTLAASGEAPFASGATGGAAGDVSEARVSDPMLLGYAAQPQIIAAAPEQPEPVPAKTEDWRVVGQALSTYIVVDTPDGILLIDKHAAHERILFEEFRAGERIVSQALIAPEITAPDREEADTVLSHLSTFRRFGFEIGDFGGGSLMIRQIPSRLDPADAAAAVSELAELIRCGGRADPTELYDELLHSLACKAAVKAGSKNSPPELYEIARQVMTREDIRFCPHGRPVAISMSRRELEKQFGRT